MNITGKNRKCFSQNLSKILKCINLKKKEKKEKKRKITHNTHTRDNTSLVPSGLKCVSSQTNWLNKQTNKQTYPSRLSTHSNVSFVCATWYLHPYQVPTILIPKPVAGCQHSYPYLYLCPGAILIPIPVLRYHYSYPYPYFSLTWYLYPKHGTQTRTHIQVPIPVPVFQPSLVPVSASVPKGWYPYPYPGSHSATRTWYPTTSQLERA